MASAEQLSIINRDGTIHKNNGINTEKTFNDCVNDTFHKVLELYPQYRFSQKKNLKNTELVSVLNESGFNISNQTLNGGTAGGCSPDGGVYYIGCDDATWLPVFIGENKWQAANQGNALERSVKNIVWFQHYLVQYDYFPYLLNLNGTITTIDRGTYYDRISMVGGFMPLNKVHVRNDPATPRIRPFTFLVNETFDYNGTQDAIMQIVKESIEYLNELNKL